MYKSLEIETPAEKMEDGTYSLFDLHKCKVVYYDGTQDIFLMHPEEYDLYKAKEALINKYPKNISRYTDELIK